MTVIKLFKRNGSKSQFGKQTGLNNDTDLIGIIMMQLQQKKQNTDLGVWDQVSLGHYSRRDD
jgi:hypothetical protein